MSGTSGMSSVEARSAVVAMSKGTSMSGKAVHAVPSSHKEVRMSKGR